MLSEGGCAHHKNRSQVFLGVDPVHSPGSTTLTELADICRKVYICGINANVKIETCAITSFGYVSGIVAVTQWSQQVRGYMVYGFWFQQALTFKFAFVEKHLGKACPITGRRYRGTSSAQKFPVGVGHINVKRPSRIQVNQAVYVLSCDPESGTVNSQWLVNAFFKEIVQRHA